MDITSMCRGCMIEIKSCEIENSNRAMEMFCFCTNISITDDNSLPTQFCNECKNHIETAYMFIKKAHNVNITLRNITSRNNTSVIVPNKQKPMILTLPNYKLCIGVSGESLDTRAITNCSKIINSNDNNSEKSVEICEDINVHLNDNKQPKCEFDYLDNLKPNTCPVCDKSFMFKSWLSKHMENECSGREFVCAVCSKKFKNKSKLVQHLLIHSEDRKYSCSMCGRQYKRRKHLTSHIKTHSTERPYACEKCPKKFKLKKILQGHMKTHDPVKQYLCSFCGWSNSLAMNLEAHLRTHTGAKPYACHMCEFRTAAAGSLRRHQLRHAQRRPHACARCGKAFYDASALERHSRTHTGERPYRCAWCARAFADSWKRKSHLMRAHGLALGDIPRMRRDGAPY